MHSLFLALGYSVASATLSIVNKWALVEFPFSSTLTLVQFAFSAGLVQLLGAVGAVEVDAPSWAKARAFAPAVVMFYLTIAANLQLLSVATVDTFIVARSVTPIFTQIGEIVFFGHDGPSSRAALALAAIALGAVGYTFNNLAAVSDADVAFWACVYVTCISADMLVVKRVVMHVELTSWGYVLYNNALSLLPYPAWASATGELARLAAADPTPLARLSTRAGAVSVALSCVLGVGISFFGLNARRELSATAFTVLGVACKFGSVLINTLAWRRHAPPAALPWLLLSLAGSIAFQFAPRPAVPPPAKPAQHRAGDQQTPRRSRRLASTPGPLDKV